MICPKPCLMSPSVSLMFFSDWEAEASAMASESSSLASFPIFELPDDNIDCSTLGKLIFGQIRDIDTKLLQLGRGPVIGA